MAPAPSQPGTIPSFEEMYSQWRTVATSIKEPTKPPELDEISAEDKELLVRHWQDFGELAPSEPVVVSSRKQWHEVRLFISSTFTDYFAEREVIVKQVSLLELVLFSLLRSYLV